MGQSDQNQSGQNAKLVIMTTLITGLITLGTAFIAIIPNLRSNDAKQIKDLQSQIAERVPTEAAPQKTISITGVVHGKDGKSPMPNCNLYLVPSNSPPMLTTQTDDNGAFTLESLPSDTYSIVVRDTATGMSGIALLNDPQNPAQTSNATISYQIK
jgi:hypothetical protein